MATSSKLKVKNPSHSDITQKKFLTSCVSTRYTTKRPQFTICSGGRLTAACEEGSPNPFNCKRSDLISSLQNGRHKFAFSPLQYPYGLQFQKAPRELTCCDGHTHRLKLPPCAHPAAQRSCCPAAAPAEADETSGLRGGGRQIEGHLHGASVRSPGCRPPSACCVFIVRGQWG